MANNYIFGTGPFAIEVAKRLEEFDIQILGFLKLKENNKNLPKKVYKDISISYIEDCEIDKDNDNIIITKKPMIMGSTIDYLRKNNFKNVYTVSEQMLFSEQKKLEELLNYFKKINFNIPFLNYMEMNVVDQCNLNCKGCAHFSNICDNNFISLESLEHDLKLIASNFYLYNFRILGGEPLLHPNLKEILLISRAIFKDTRIVVVTNGLLIKRLDSEVLRTFANCNIEISISLYQNIYEELNEILEILNQYGIHYLINDDYFKAPEVIKSFQTKLGLEKTTDGDIASQYCFGQFCRFLRDGKITKCYYPLLIDILNKKLGTNYIVTNNDFINLEDIQDGWEVIEKLNNPIPFCDYCRKDTKSFEWECNHKNDNDVYSYVLKK